MYKISSALISILFFLTSYSQKDIQVYIEKRLSGEDKNAIAEMTHLLKRTGRFSFQFDSVNKFSGSGIYVTTTAYDYYKKRPAKMDKMGQEGIYVKSDNSYIYITSNSSLGLKEALFVYLKNLGFRFYFPDPLWHIIPQLNSVFKKSEVLCEPSFTYRTISMGWGEGNDKLRQEHLFWQRANCMGGAFGVNTGHAYNILFLDNKKEFEAQPEYLTKPLVNGNLQAGVAFNYASEGLAQLAYDWVVRTFDNYQRLGRNLPMLSLEPFDGNTLCDLPACKIIGTTSSDQIMYFTNKVAQKLKKTHPLKQIGLLAYNDHIDIPRYKAEDNIFITITNGFNRSKYTTDELIKRWRTKVKGLGIYDYMSVYSWDFDLPGKGLAGNYNRVAENLRKYNKQGVKAYIAESTYGWINKGLGHYVAAELLWNINTDPAKITEPFFDLMFPQTKNEIKELFRRWQQLKGVVPAEEDLYQWFSLVKTAFLKCNNEKEILRLNQVAAYLNYTKLFREYGTASADKRTAKGSDVLSYMWQTLDAGFMASYAGINELPNQLGAVYSNGSKTAEWKQKKINYPDNKEQWIKAIDGFNATFKRMDKIQQFDISTKIATPDARKLSSKPNWPNIAKEFTVQNEAKIIIDLNKSDSLFLRITAGRLNKMGIATVNFYNWNDSLVVKGNPVKTFTINADGNNNYIDFKKLPRKKYIIGYSDNGSGSKIYFPGKLKFSVLASADNPLTGGFYNAFYFYVPPGVTKFYVAKTGHLRLTKPGKVFTDYETNVDVAEINVKEDEAGWWLGQLQLNDMYFIGIPPFISLTPESYLLPKQ